MTHIQDFFIQKYQHQPTLFTAPGRINIIGEHTDYNMGLVLPAAIDKAITFAVAPNESREIRITAIDLGEEVSVFVDEISPLNRQWPNYLLGVVDQLQRNGYKFGGFDCVFGGNIPLGAGLSSSAAVECGLAFALNHIFDLGIEKMELVKMAQLAEHTYAGVKCGIMDQFASTFGKENHVVRLDCRSLDYEYFPLNMSGYKIMLCNTRVSHSLADSEYNTRREECETGVQILQKHYPGVQSLRDTNIQQLQKHVAEFPPVIYQRCKYVVEEIQRVEDSCAALNEGNIEHVGQLMYQSHHGLQHEYQVSCPELDFLVDLVRDDSRVLGSRMMGGGFGGCTINIVKADAVEGLTETCINAYEKQFGHKPEIYITSITDGCRLTPANS
ncbi:MAG: galactokinase [Bacteroidetes bacterium]|nr:galactokinase [Bacteroidota bacterium]